MPDPKARLDEFDVEEVSAVDRAANGEKFLVVKNQGGDAMQDEKDKAEDATKASDENGAGAGMQAGATTEKMVDGAPAHMAILEELAAALRESVEAIVSTAMNGGDFEAAVRHMDGMWGLIHRIRESASVVSLLKSATKSPLMAVEKAWVDSKAVIVEKMRLAQAKADVAKAQAETSDIKTVIAKLDDLGGKMSALSEAQAKADVAKALADVTYRVTKMEAAIHPPTTGAAVGSQREDARKSDAVVWTNDLAQKQSS